MRGWRRKLGARAAHPFTAKPGQGLTDDGPVQGLPIGGLGSGSIGIDHDGRFARWHLNPGCYRYLPSEACFLQVARPGAGARRLLGDEAGPGTYEALYPVATRRQSVPDLDLEVKVRQWSPVIPHNYVESAWPVGFFEVEARSPRGGKVEVSLEFAAPDGVVPPGAKAGFAVASERATLDLEPGQPATAAFALAWDLPEIHFGSEFEHAWLRPHTRQFGAGGDAAARIAEAALRERARLAGQVSAWHASLDRQLRGWGAPRWLLPALLNELYMMVEGGTAWVLGPDGEEHFGILESLDYAYYETLDVRYYSSFAVLELWPRLERLVSADYIRALSAADAERYQIEWVSGITAPRMLAGAAPHDLGSPREDPFRRPNAYTLQDSTNWKDLNPKLVLILARNLLAMHDDSLLAAAWPACRQALRYLEAFDRDGDGIPENQDLPDQTYDTWPMRGVSAYCADLWVAALAAGERLARRAGDLDEAHRLRALRERAAAKLEEALWTGSHYRFDASAGPLSDTVIADQLAGTWYAELLHLDPVHPPERVDRALGTVLASNFYGFAGARLGPINGRSPDGGPAGGGEQASEVWVGVAWGLASLCLLIGRVEDAWRIGEALYSTLYRRSGLWFRTPEAWTEDRKFRAAMYHRGLAVWSLVPALRRRAERASN